MKVIPDKAEIDLEFPDKVYIGTFGRNARFDVHSDAVGVALRLERHDDQKRKVDVHLHHGLLADILDEIARCVGEQPPIDDSHRQALLAAARRLVNALGAKR
jgi:hypothetical protein